MIGMTIMARLGRRSRVTLGRVEASPAGSWADRIGSSPFSSHALTLLRSHFFSFVSLGIQVRLYPWISEFSVHILGELLCWLWLHTGHEARALLGVMENGISSSHMQLGSIELSYLVQVRVDVDETSQFPFSGIQRVRFTVGDLPTLRAQTVESRIARRSSTGAASVLLAWSSQTCLWGLVTGQLCLTIS